METVLPNSTVGAAGLNTRALVVAEVQGLSIMTSKVTWPVTVNYASVTPLLSAIVTTAETAILDV